MKAVIFIYDFMKNTIIDSLIIMENMIKYHNDM